MYSIRVDDKFLDFKYKKINDFMYNFYIGDIFIGQVSKMKEKSWAGISWRKPSKICPVFGFRSRYHASEFLLKLNGYM